MPTKTARGKWLLQVHDVVNVAVISGLLVLSALMYLDKHEKGTSNWFLPLAYSTLLYLLLDTTFILWYPELFPRMISLVIHHAATVALVIHTIMYPEHEGFLLYGMLVEVNTFCLVAFKVWKSTVFEWCHLFTWIALRLCWYPYLVFVYHTEMSLPAYSMLEYGSVLVPQFTLVLLCVFWTLEIVAFWKRAPKEHSKDD